MKQSAGNEFTNSRARTLRISLRPEGEWLVGTDIRWKEDRPVTLQYTT